MSIYTEAINSENNVVQNLNLLDALAIECSYAEQVKQFVYQGLAYYSSGNTEESKHPKLRTSQLLTTVEYLINNFPNILTDGKEHEASQDVINCFKDISTESSPTIYCCFENGEVKSVTVKDVKSNFQYMSILYGFKNMIVESTNNIIMNSAIQKMLFMLQSAAMGVPMEQKTPSGIIV